MAVSGTFADQAQPALGARDVFAELRDLEELMPERGITSDQSTMLRWVIDHCGTPDRQHVGAAGKRRNTRVRKSGNWLKTALVTAAWAAVRVKASYLHAQFLRIKARRCAKKAILLAVAASMLTAAYQLLRDGVDYADLGPDYFARHDTDKTIRRLLKRLADLGCHVDPTPHSGPRSCW